MKGANDMARRTKKQIEQLEAQIYEALLNDNPQTVRHVFYLMTNPRLPEPVEKSDRGYRGVQYRLSLMRKSGVIPYGWIADTSRRAYRTSTYSGSGDFLKRHAGAYRADLWDDSEYYLEVWSESRSLAGVLEDDCRELAVSLYPSGGFSSDTFIYESACEIERAYKKAVIIYVGDYDPAGVLIDQDIERKLRMHLGSDYPLAFDRVAINSNQIAEYDLPTKPRKATDKRALHVQDTVEAEAMPARLMRQLVKDKVENYLPEDALKVAKIAESHERDLMAKVGVLIEEKRDDVEDFVQQWGWN